MKLFQTVAYKMPNGRHHNFAIHQYSDISADILIQDKPDTD